MNYIEKWFSIHDIMQFVVIDHTGVINRFFDNINTHYENFSVQKNDKNSDLIIEIGNFTPDLNDVYETGNKKYFFKPNYMFIPRERHKGAEWKFEITGLNDPTTIVKIDCNYLGRIFITGNIVDFLIHLKLLQKGFSLIHASAVAKNGFGYLLSSRGGGGKTTYALELLENGYDFLGDNYVIINKDTIFSYPTSLSIFTYNLRPSIMGNISSFEKLLLGIKKIIYNLTGGYAKIFSKINPKRITNNIIYSSKIGGIILLIPRNVKEYYAAKLIKSDKNTLIKKIVYNQMLEFNNFNRYIDEYSYLFPIDPFSSHWETYRDSLVENLDNNSILFYQLDVPVHFDNKVKNLIIELINNDSNKVQL
jgi:hypothetical protein